uniref:MATA-HMG n=3 Tax=Rhizophagus irregularis TaxID=588596 RepID=A0A1B1EUD5_9GLOM|nr:MATA-HMG [Rhizophagus irregularis]ANQ32417.1 MATA-HMG [Rhizophagus irregularis]
MKYLYRVTWSIILTITNRTNNNKYCAINGLTFNKIQISQSEREIIIKRTVFNENTFSLTMNKPNQARKSNKNEKKYLPDPNKSDEDIVNESKHLLNCDVDMLAVNSETTRRHEYMLKNRIKLPPRPLNAFILYRRDLMNNPEFKDRPAREKKAKKVSKEIADRWHNENDETKNVFYALARIANKKHKEIYKNYKFIRKIRKNKNSENVEEPYIPSNSFQTETSPGPLNLILPSSTNPTLSNLVQDSDSISSPNLVNPNFTYQIYNDFGLANVCQTYDSFGLTQQLYNRFELENIQQTSDNVELTDEELSNFLQTYNNFELAEESILQTYDTYTNIPQQPNNDSELEYIHQTDDSFELTNVFQQEVSDIFQAYDSFESANIPQQPYNGFTSMMIFN